MPFFAVLVMTMFLIGLLPPIYFFIISTVPESFREVVHAAVDWLTLALLLDGGGIAGWSSKPLFENHFDAWSYLLRLEGELQPLPISPPPAFVAVESVITLVWEVLFFIDIFYSYYNCLEEEKKLPCVAAAPAVLREKIFCDLLLASISSELFSRANYWPKSGIIPLLQ